MFTLRGVRTAAPTRNKRVAFAPSTFLDLLLDELSPIELLGGKQIVGGAVRPQSLLVMALEYRIGLRVLDLKARTAGAPRPIRTTILTLIPGLFENPFLDR